MEYPPDKAESLLRKWLDLNTVLTVSLSGPRFSVSTGGTVVDVDISSGVRIASLAVKSRSGEVTAAPGELIVSFEGASFEYVESREAPLEIRESAEAMFVCTLTIKVPNPQTPDFVLTLAEMRNQPDTVGETTVH